VSSVSGTVDRPQDRVITRHRAKRDWSKVFLAIYFVLFLFFLYTPMVLMGVLSFQGAFGGVTFPFRGPASVTWWKSLVDASVPGSHADEIRAAGTQSFWFSLAAGAIVAVIAFTLSLAFRRRFRGDGVAFYVIMLALMTPGFLLGLGNQLFWRFLEAQTSIWKTALGANVIWGIPFGFLVMLAVWNRYDEHIEEAARDLGANQRRTFREVTLPLVWTGVFGCFLFGFTLAWNDYDRTVLLLSGFDTATLPIQIFGLTFSQAIRPDLYALGAATTAITLLIILVSLIAVTLLARRRGARVVRVEEELGETVALDRAATVAR
jgi:putative spermidine/putrescine transport system permease protein